MVVSFSGCPKVSAARAERRQRRRLRRPSGMAPKSPKARAKGSPVGAPPPRPHTLLSPGGLWYWPVDGVAPVNVMVGDSVPANAVARVGSKRYRAHTRLEAERLASRRASFAPGTSPGSGSGRPKRSAAARTAATIATPGSAAPSPGAGDKPQSPAPRPKTGNKKAQKKGGTPAPDAAAPDGDDAVDLTAVDAADTDPAPASLDDLVAEYDKGAKPFAAYCLADYKRAAGKKKVKPDDLLAHTLLLSARVHKHKHQARSALPSHLLSPPPPPPVLPRGGLCRRLRRTRLADSRRHRPP